MILLLLPYLLTSATIFQLATFTEWHAAAADEDCFTYHKTAPAYYGTYVLDALV